MPSSRSKSEVKGLVPEIFMSILIPTILMNITSAVSGFADSIIVGNFLGEMALSAITFCLPIFMFINTIASMLAVGGATTIGVLLGKGDKENANKVFSCAITWGLLIAVTCAVLGVVFIDPLVGFLGASGEVAGFVKAYTIVIVAAVPAFVLNILFAFFVRNDGRPKLAMTGMLTAIFANIILDIIFIGPCNMGIAGGAYAMITSQILSVMIIGSHFFTKQNNLRYKFVLSFEILTRIVRNGVGTSMSFIYQMITMLVLNHLIMSRSGADGMVVYSVVTNINTIAMSIFEGVSQTIQPMISVYHGEKNEVTIKQTMNYAFVTGGIICGVVILILEIFPGGVAGLLGVTDVALREASIVATRMVAPAMLFMTLNVLLSYYFQSREVRSLPFVIVICRNLVILLLGFVLISTMFGAGAMWLSYLFAEIVTLLISIILAKGIGVKSGKQSGILLQWDTPNSFYDTDTETKEDLIAFLEKQQIEASVQEHLRYMLTEFNAIAEKAKGKKEVCKELNIYIDTDTETKEMSVQYWYNGKIGEPENTWTLNESQEVEQQPSFGVEYLTTLGKNRLTLVYPLV